MTTTDDIRRWAMALPEGEETSHFHFHVPVFKIRGRTFLGLGKDRRGHLAGVPGRLGGARPPS